MTVSIQVKHLSKLFNDESGEGLERLLAGESKEEIFRATGTTVGVQDVSFEVNEGEIFVIMGLSGSGKSTLVRMLNGLIPPTSGEVWIRDVDVASCDSKRLREVRRQKLSMVFQHFALFPHKTIADNVAFGLRVKGLGKAERREAALRSLEQVGLDAYADSFPGQLSGGMQQRVGLARALCNDPEILLMDEPFGALDPLIRREMQDELVVLQKQLKKTIVFITHDLNEALLLGDRIAIMKDGAFVQVGTAQEIVAAPADEYVRAFVADIDRSRVFTSRDIAEEPATVQAGATGQDALAEMDRMDSEAAHVMDGDGVAGIVTRRAAGEAADRPVSEIMQSPAPVIGQEAYIHEIYSAASSGLPVGVTDGEGKLMGVVPPGAIFTQLAVEAVVEPDPAAEPDPEAATAAPAAGPAGRVPA